MNLGDDPKAVTTAVAELGDRLTELPSSDLVAGFAVTFATPTDNHPVALELVEEIVRRNDVAAQKALVVAILAALERYDAGHRAHDGSVFDRLIDEALPRLELEALGDLLGRLEPDHLAADGDGFGALYGQALERAAGTPHEGRLLRLALGDTERPPAAAPTAEQRAELVAQLDDAELRLPGSSSELEALHALVRGAELDREHEAAYLKLLIPESNRVDPERLAAIDMLFELAELDLAWLRARVVAWGLPAERLAPVLFGVTRLDDIGEEYDTPARRALLEQIRAWAFEVDGRPAHPIDDEDIRIRVPWILEHAPSREARARRWLALAAQPVPVERAIRDIVNVAEKLNKARLHERVLAWLDLVPKLEVEPHALTELWYAGIASAADLGRRDVLAKLDASLPHDDPAIERLLVRAFALVGDREPAIAAFRRYLALGGEPTAWASYDDMAKVPRIAAIDDLSAAATETLRSAAYEGVNIKSAEARRAVLTGAPEITPDAVDRAHARGIEALAELVLGGAAGRYHERLREAILAATEPVAVDARHLASLLERLRDAGNNRAIVEWMAALPKLGIGGRDRGAVRALGLAAAAAVSDRDVETRLAEQATAPELKCGELLLELARYHARCGDRDQVLALTGKIPASYSYGANKALESVEQDPDLGRYAAEIRTSLRGQAH